MLVLWFRVEGYAFEMLAAVMAEEAFWVETDSCCGNDASGNGECALLTESASADSRGGPMGAGGVGRGVAVEGRLALGRDR